VRRNFARSVRFSAASAAPYIYNNLLRDKEVIERDDFLTGALLAKQTAVRGGLCNQCSGAFGANEGGMKYLFLF